MGSYLLRSGRDDSLLLGDLQLHIGGMTAPLDTAAGMLHYKYATIGKCCSVVKQVVDIYVRIISLITLFTGK